MLNLLKTLAIAASIAISYTMQAQITTFDGEHDMSGEVTHSIVASLPPFVSSNEYEQVSPVSTFGPSTSNYSLVDQVFVASNISMTSSWDVSNSQIVGQISKSGNSSYSAPSGDRINPFYESDSTSSFAVQLEEAGTPYRITVTWDLGPVVTTDDGAGYSTFHVTVGNAILTSQIGSIAGGTEENVGLATNLGPEGTYVFEGVTVVDSLAFSARLFGPGYTRGIAGCLGEPCGTGSVQDMSYVSYEIIVGDEALPLDSDGDDVADNNDNCTNVPNTDQYDSNGDGFGNLCDPDLDNNGVVNFADYVMIADRFLATPDSPNWLADADFNNDGAINFSDVALISSYFLLPPGPSGTAP